MTLFLSGPTDLKRPNCGPRSHRRWSRGGFTLLEMMLVLGILAMLAAMAWPSYQSLLEQRRLSGEAESLRSLLREARRQAMADGVVYRWDFDPKTNRHRIVPASCPLRGDGTAKSRPDDKLGEDESPPPFMIEKELAPLLRFVRPDELDAFIEGNDGKESPAESPDSKSEKEAAKTSSDSSPSLPPGENGLSQGEWQPRFEFIPDGSSYDAAIEIADELKRFVEIRVVGLTGEVVVSDLQQRDPEKQSKEKRPNEEKQPDEGLSSPSVAEKRPIENPDVE